MNQCPCSSAETSSGLLIRGSQVRFLPGTPQSAGILRQPAPAPGNVPDNRANSMPAKKTAAKAPAKKAAAKKALPPFMLPAKGGKAGKMGK